MFLEGQVEGLLEFIGGMIFWIASNPDRANDAAKFSLYRWSRDLPDAPPPPLQIEKYAHHTGQVAIRDRLKEVLEAAPSDKSAPNG